LAPRNNEATNPRLELPALAKHSHNGNFAAILALSIFLLPVAGFLLLASIIYAFSLVDETQPADAAIVLGYTVIGGEPSLAFRERINHAIQLYRLKIIGKIIFTGGKGEGIKQAESWVAREYALGQNVPANDILCEFVSTTTVENLVQARAIVSREQMNRVLIVSDPLHMKRAMTISRDVGLTAFSSPTRTTRITGWQSQMRFLFRETCFYGKYLMQRARTLA
jgi:uncharacterized SAM-binding protein YcdF (DUF218 family)